MLVRKSFVVVVVVLASSQNLKVLLRIPHTFVPKLGESR